MSRYASGFLLLFGISSCQAQIGCEVSDRVRSGDVDGLRKALSQSNAMEISCDGVDFFSLAAVSRNGYESAQILIGAGIRPKAFASNGTTSLHEAAMWADKSMVQLLVENGMNPELKDADGALPVDLARERGGRDGLEIATYLDSKEKDPEKAEDRDTHK